MRQVTVAAIQMQMTESLEDNIVKADEKVREAAAKGANVILLPELFERPYFCTLLHGKAVIGRTPRSQRRGYTAG